MVEMKYPGVPVRILLGGGIGSGKSAAGRRFEELGAVVVDADRLGHTVLEPDGEAFWAVSERWPSVIADSRIERSVLAEIVFTDPEQLAELEALTHPPIIGQIVELASGPGDLVVEIPLILGVSGEWTRVFIDADEDVRLRRAVERGGNEADVRRRMANQSHRDEWTTWADVTIDNNGSIDELETQIDDLWYERRATDNGPQA